MPTKRNPGPAPDNAAFRDRLEKCANRVGSANQLAIQSGIPQATISGHKLRGSEPTRPALIAIANTAKVNLLWLVAGLGPIEGETNAPATKPDPVLLEIFRRRLEQLAKGKGGYGQLAAHTGLAPTVLDELSSGREPTVTELVILARKCAVEINSLLAADIDAESLAFAADPRQYEGRGTTFATPEHGKGVMVSLDIMANATNLYQSIVERFSHAKHLWIEMPDNTMETAFKKGDILIVREQNMISASGVYLVQGPRNRFITRALVRDDDSILIYFDNKNYKAGSKQLFSADRHICQGRVVANLTDVAS